VLGVATPMTTEGLFWVRMTNQVSEGVLSVISHSIKYVDDC